MTTTHSKKYRLVLVLLGVAAVILGVLLFRYCSELRDLLQGWDVATIEAYVSHAGPEGAALLVGFQVLETIAIVLPAIPVYICAGAVFGKLRGFLMCYVTNILMNLLIFWVARRFKRRTWQLLSHTKSAKLVGWFERTDHPGRIVLIMCLLPVVPNGLIPYIAAQTRLSLGEFIKPLALGCLPAIALYACFGDILLSEHWRFAIPIVAVLVVLLVLYLIFRRQVREFLERKIRQSLFRPASSPLEPDGRNQDDS